MAQTTPWLSASPEYQALLGLVVKDPRTFVSSELAELVLFDQRRQIVWRSPTFEPRNRLVDFGSTIRLYADKKSLFRLYLYYRKVHKGFPRQVIIKVAHNMPLPSKDGKVHVQASALIAGYPSAVRKARTSVHRQIKSAKTAASDALKATTLRPSPETKITPYLRVIEGRVFGTYSITVTPTSRTLTTRTWTGVRTPGFAKLKKRQLPVNPHTVSSKVYPKDILFHWTRNNFRPVGDFNSEIDRFTLKYAEPAAPTHSTLAQNMAVKRLIEKAGNEIQANLAQDIAQISQTTRLIAVNTQKIVKSFVSLKKGNLSGAVRALTTGRTGTRQSPRKSRPSIAKDLAENWLELQYGWKPLLKDIEGSMNALGAMHLADQYVRRVTASAKARSSSSATFTSVLWSAKSGTHQLVQDTHCKITIRYKIADEMTAFLAQTGFTNPVNLAWEILPFSFVLDWFLPIGPYLETLSAWHGLQFLDGCQTLFTRQETVSTAAWSAQQLGGGVNNNYEENAQLHRSWVLLNRTKLTSFPSLQVPEFRNGLENVTRAVNAVALLKAVFGK